MSLPPTGATPPDGGSSSAENCDAGDDSDPRVGQQRAAESQSRGPWPLPACRMTGAPSFEDVAAEIEALAKLMELPSVRHVLETDPSAAGLTVEVAAFLQSLGRAPLIPGLPEGTTRVQVARRELSLDKEVIDREVAAIAEELNRVRTNLRRFLEWTTADGREMYPAAAADLAVFDSTREEPPSSPDGRRATRPADDRRSRSGSTVAGGASRRRQFLGLGTALLLVAIATLGLWGMGVRSERKAAELQAQLEAEQRAEQLQFSRDLERATESLAQAEAALGAGDHPLAGEGLDAARKQLRRYRQLGLGAGIPKEFDERTDLVDYHLQAVSLLEVGSQALESELLEEARTALTELVDSLTKTPELHRTYCPQYDSHLLEAQKKLNQIEKTVKAKARAKAAAERRRAEEARLAAKCGRRPNPKSVARRWTRNAGNPGMAYEIKSCTRPTTDNCWEYSCKIEMIVPGYGMRQSVRVSFRTDKYGTAPVGVR